MSDLTTADLPVALQFELATDILKLISYRLEDVETVVFAEGEFVDVIEIRDMLRTVRDDIFDQIEYKGDATSTEPATKLGDPDHEPADFNTE